MERPNWKSKLADAARAIVGKPVVEKKQTTSMVDRVKAKVLAEKRKQDQLTEEHDDLVQLAQMFGSIGKARRYKLSQVRRLQRRSRREKVRALEAEVRGGPLQSPPTRLRDRVRVQWRSGTLKEPGQLRTERRKRLRTISKEARRRNR